MSTTYLEEVPTETIIIAAKKIQKKKGIDASVAMAAISRAITSFDPLKGDLYQYVMYQHLPNGRRVEKRYVREAMQEENCDFGNVHFSALDIEDEEGNMIEYEPGAKADPLRNAIQAEQSAAVRAALKQLSPECRRIIFMMNIEDMSAAEISEQTGWKLSKIYVCKREAEAMLRRLLRDYAPER